MLDSQSRLHLYLRLRLSLRLSLRLLLHLRLHPLASGMCRVKVEAIYLTKLWSREWMMRRWRWSWSQGWRLVPSLAESRLWLD